MKSYTPKGVVVVTLTKINNSRNILLCYYYLNIKSRKKIRRYDGFFIFNYLFNPNHLKDFEFCPRFLCHLMPQQ